MPSRNVMLDLETLGTNSDAVVVSIGAVFFDEKTLSKEGFYAVLDLEDQVKRGRKLNAGTVCWWMQQSEEARNVFKSSKKDVIDVLEDFSEFLGDENVLMWGNGADFDCVITGSLYDTYGIKRPWSYSNNRCFRTLKNIALAKDSHKMPERKGVYHNALHDAIYQAEMAQAYLKGKLK